jgi:hypothetical protein
VKFCKKILNPLLRRLRLFVTIKRRCRFILDNPWSSITETVHKFKIWIFSNEDHANKRFAYLKLIPSVAASHKIELGMSKILQGYLQESTSFDETKSNLSTYFARAGLEVLNDESLLSFEEKLQSLGFYCNSLDLHKACFNLTKGVRDDTTIKSKGWAATYRDFLLNMYSGRIQNANNSLEELYSSRGSYEPFRRTVIRELDHYIFLASNGKYGSRIEIKDDKFADLIRGRDLLIIGPGNGPQIDFTLIPSDTLVVRMLKPGLLDWSSEYSNEKKLSEIGYISGETAVYLEGQSDSGWSKDFKSLCFRSSSNLSSSLVQGRQLVTNNHLLRRGAPQMLLYAIWDLSIFRPRSIMITNVDFYSTKTPLRLNSRRIFKKIDGSEVQVSSSGSAGMPFDRCRTHALHGTVYNRNVMKMIFRNEIFHLSHETKAAIEYSDEDYCARLEDAIGRMRI